VGVKGLKEGLVLTKAVTVLCASKFSVLIIRRSLGSLLTAEHRDASSEGLGFMESVCYYLKTA